MKRFALAAALFVVTPAFAQQADPVAEVKSQWQATMITGQANLARSVDALITAYQAAVATANYWRDACASTPACAGEPAK